MLCAAVLPDIPTFCQICRSEKIPPETNHSDGRHSVLYQSANSLVERERSFSTSLKIRSIFFCSIRTTFPEAMS